VEADDGADQPAVAGLARSAGCVELEAQAHVASVDQQYSCRRGTERAYVLTFRSTADRDSYLTRGPQVVPGGYDVVGPTWLVHVEAAATARILGTRLGGVVRPG
jgi:hypothetical protein